MAKEKEEKDGVKNNSVKSVKSIKSIKPKEIVKLEVETKFDIEGRFIHIKVGNDNFPADDKAISSIEEKITDIIEQNNIKCIVFVTHHAVDIKIC